MMNTLIHHPVMLNEIITGLNIHPDGIYIDGTFGRGGHSQAILQRLGENGKLLCFDKDPEAIAHGKNLLGQDKRVTFIHGCFSEIHLQVKQQGLEKKVNGILLDLGVSSPQLDDAMRGFSFMREGPLDMRMDNSQGLTAEEWINTAEEKDISFVLKIYGEERFARRIARNIIKHREEAPISTTQALSRIVSLSRPVSKNGRHVATKTFQAIRIFINQELEVLNQTLAALEAILAPGGRVAVLSFHSLEDRIVKQFFSEKKECVHLRRLPLREIPVISPFKWVEKRARATMEETTQNARARSATLRIAERNV